MLSPSPGAPAQVVGYYAKFNLAATCAVRTDRIRFLDCEKWRREFQHKEFPGGVDQLTRDFDYKEKPQVFKYYPQYYHKIDKVRLETAETPCVSTS